MTPKRFFILIGALAAFQAGMQPSRHNCPACVVLPKAPDAFPATNLNSTTPKP